MAWTDPVDFNEPMIVDEVDMNLMQDNLRALWHEVAYVEFTAAVTATTGVNTEAAPIDIVSAGALTYVANPIMVEVFIPVLLFNNATEGMSLWDATTDLGRLTKSFGTGGTYTRRLTPTAASHTYKARLWTGDGSNATATAGAGGVGTAMPGFIRVLQKGGV